MELFSPQNARKKSCKKTRILRKKTEIFCKNPQESCKKPARIKNFLQKFIVFLNFLAGHLWVLAGKLWPTCGGSGGNHGKESERVGWPERVRKELFFIVFLGIFWCCKEFNKTCVPERVRKELCCKSFCKNLARIRKNPARVSARIYCINFLFFWIFLQDILWVLAGKCCFFQISCRISCFGFVVSCKKNWSLRIVDQSLGQSEIRHVRTCQDLFYYVNLLFFMESLVSLREFIIFVKSANLLSKFTKGKSLSPNHIFTCIFIDFTPYIFLINNFMIFH